jgi:hypothetical protein
VTDETLTSALDLEQVYRDQGPNFSILKLIKKILLDVHAGYWELGSEGEKRDPFS